MSEPIGEKQSRRPFLFKTCRQFQADEEAVVEATPATDVSFDPRRGR